MFNVATDDFGYAYVATFDVTRRALTTSTSMRKFDGAVWKRRLGPVRLQRRVPE